MCQVLQVSESGYYRYIKNPIGARKKHDLELIVNIKKSHMQNRETAGTRTIYRDLKRNNISCSEKKIRMLKQEHNIYPKSHKKFKATTNSNHNLPVAQNILNRNFDIKQPNRVYVTDITYIGTGEGWLYQAIVKNLCTKEIVGYSMEERMTKELVKNALRMAIARKSPKAGLICHSDRGSQYCSYEYQALLRKHGFICSMSRKGNCWDNAPCESFFATLKKDLIYNTHYKTRQEAKTSCFEYIEIFYNRVSV